LHGAGGVCISASLFAFLPKHYASLQPRASVTRRIPDGLVEVLKRPLVVAGLRLSDPTVDPCRTRFRRHLNRAPESLDRAVIIVLPRACESFAD